MTQVHNHCSDELLQRILMTDEDSDGDQAAANHVQHCSQCQRRLDELAAEDGCWLEAREMLVGRDKTDVDQSLQDAAQPWARCDWQRGAVTWSESRACQLLSPPTHPEMLGRIGRYEVERLIGAGGMGVVFKAFDTELNRPVAVKLLAPYLAGSGAARRRFAREARAAAAVVHEHVVGIHNVESNKEAPFLVMQYVAGESLQQRLDREGPLELCEILRIAMQTASGLAAAHAQGLVHRDVKPSNILLENGVDRALLSDFGLARAGDDAALTHTGYHPGTPQYMSPEQVRGDTVDARSDLFSLGSVMYAMCTGRAPFRAETSYAVLRRITDAEPRPVREVNANIPGWVEQIIRRLLAKSPKERFQTAEQVATLLEGCLAHVQQPLAVNLPSECRAAPAKRQHALHWQRQPAALALTALIVLIGVIGGLALQFLPNPEQGPTSKAAMSSPPRPGAAAPEPAPSEHLIGWNDLAESIESFRQELAPLETASEQVWDLQPIRSGE